MQITDTRTRARIDLTTGHTVRVYVCGITPYDSTHLGHAFTYVTTDALIGYLEHAGHRVQYTRNVTDVDDDILRRAAQLDMDYLELGNREIARFDADLANLGCRVPDHTPRATEFIPAILTAVQGLLTTGHAYVTSDGRVYYDTASAEGFGQLSRLQREEMLHQFAEKGGDPHAAGKRDALDFLMWQPSEPGEPAWDSPWGAGRPGWHIECSVMATETLGNTIDLHGGGNDLVFPHHEAEILQAEGLTGQAPFVRAWFHVGMVTLDGVKMSKSLGNLVFVSDLLERYESDAIRRYLLEHHYRQGFDFSDSALDDAAAGVKRWREALHRDDRRPDLEARFAAAMADDLDTPTALSVLDEAAAAGAGATVRELAGALRFTVAS